METISTSRPPILQWSTFRPTIRGWFTAIPSSAGRGGIPIPESGLAARISPSESALVLAGSAVSAGDGGTGDSTGTTITCSTITDGTFPRAERFITATIFIAAELMVWPRAAAATTVTGRPGRSTAIATRPEAMLLRAVKVEFAPAPLATSTTADRPEASPPADSPASAAVRVAVADHAAVAARTAVVADVTNRR